MRSSLLGLVSAMALAGFGTAHAADLAMPVRAPALSALYNWTGFYVGANVGAAVANNPSALPFMGQVQADLVTLAPDGIAGGLQVGYNFQISNWVLGVEGDWQWSSQEDSFCFNCVLTAPGRAMAQELPWFATVRGRVGYAYGSLLFYATGGVAFGEVKTEVTCCFGGPILGFSETKTGWTAGVGIEASIAGNWTAKVEYLYLDLGTVTHSAFTPAPFGPATVVPTSEIRTHLARLGLNYRFGATPARAAAPAWGAAANWTGIYVGLNGGYGAGRNPVEQDFAPGGPNARTIVAPDGWLGGGQIGFNWQVQNVVLGVEADFQWTGQEDTMCRNCPPIGGTLTTSIEHRLPWLGTARGRVGLAEGPALFYVTGGLAFGRVDIDVTQISPPLSNVADFGFTRTGWTLGGGIETLIAGNWSAKLEYLYVDLGSATTAVSAPGFTTLVLPTDIRDHIFRVGLNYRFGPSALPVVAKN